MSPANARPENSALMEPNKSPKAPASAGGLYNKETTNGVASQSTTTPTTRRKMMLMDGLLSSQFSFFVSETEGVSIDNLFALLNLF